jgi:hypothetical protein
LIKVLDGRLCGSANGIVQRRVDIRDFMQIAGMGRGYPQQDHGRHTNPFGDSTETHHQGAPLLNHFVVKGRKPPNW